MWCPGSIPKSSWRRATVSASWPSPMGPGMLPGWLTGETQRLLRKLIGAREGIRTDIPQHLEIWAQLCGWYRPRAQRTDMMAWSVFGAGQDHRPAGQLILRTLSRYRPYTEAYSCIPTTK